jgi:hypothetical protein
MSIIFAGGELGDFDTGSSGFITATGRDSNYSRITLGTSSSSDNFVKTVPAQTEFWGKWRSSYGSSTLSTGRVPLLLTSATGNVARIYCASSSALDLQRWNGTAWVTVASVSLVNGVSFYTVQVKTGASGAIRFYRDGSLLAEYLGDTTALGSVNTMTLGSNGGTYNYISEVIIANHDIRSARLKTLDVTAAGAHTGWAGTWQDIDAYDELDTSFISSTVAGQKSTFVVSDLPTDSLVVDSVILSGRFRRNATGPSGVNALARIGGVDYGQSVGALTEQFASKQVVLGTNPATGGAWDKTTVNALEIGVESVA